MKRIPRKNVDTSRGGKIMSQLAEPPNPEYILYLLEKYKPTNHGKAMKLVMTQYHGRANPAMVNVIIKEYFADE
jgi:hypothetical protein